MPTTFPIDSKAQFVAADEDAEVTVSNGGAGTVYYSTQRSVTSIANDGSIAPGASVTRRAPTWLCTAATTQARVTVTETAQIHDTENVHGIPDTQALIDVVNSALSYKGTWNASTNTPTLVDGTGTDGDYYQISTAASRNLGSGSQTFSEGDYILYDDGEWTKVGGPTALRTYIDSRIPARTVIGSQYFGALAAATLTQYGLRIIKRFIPQRITITGLGYVVGDASNGNVKVCLAPASTRIIAASSSSTAQGSINTHQKVAFSSSITVDPGEYLLGIVSDSTTGKCYITQGCFDPYTVQSLANFTLPGTALSDPGTDPTATFANPPVLWTY